MATEKPTKIIINCETGEQKIVPLTDEEIAQREADALAYAEQQAAIEAEQAAKQALKESAIAKLTSGQPLTPEEAATIVL